MTPAEAQVASEDAYYLRSLLVLLLVGFVPEVYDQVMTKQMGHSRAGSGRALAGTVRMVVQSNPQFVNPARGQGEESHRADEPATDGPSERVPAAQPPARPTPGVELPGVPAPDGGEGPGQSPRPDATGSQP